MRLDPSEPRAPFSTSRPRPGRCDTYAIARSSPLRELGAVRGRQIGLAVAVRDAWTLGMDAIEAGSRRSRRSWAASREGAGRDSARLGAGDADRHLPEGGRGPRRPARGSGQNKTSRNAGALSRWISDARGFDALVRAACTITTTRRGSLHPVVGASWTVQHNGPRRQCAGRAILRIRHWSMREDVKSLSLDSSAYRLGYSRRGGVGGTCTGTLFWEPSIRELRLRFPLAGEPAGWDWREHFSAQRKRSLPDRRRQVRCGDIQFRQGRGAT